MPVSPLAATFATRAAIRTIATGLAPRRTVVARSAVAPRLAPRLATGLAARFAAGLAAGFTPVAALVAAAAAGGVHVQAFGFGIARNARVPLWPPNPMEFEIAPVTGTVRA